MVKTQMLHPLPLSTPSPLSCLLPSLVLTLGVEIASLCSHPFAEQRIEQKKPFSSVFVLCNPRVSRKLTRYSLLDSEKVSFFL